MTILPIATNEYMSELEVSFRNLYKEEMQLQSEKGSESDVLIGKVSLNDSVDARYYKDQPIKLTNDIEMQFISTTIMHPLLKLLVKNMEMVTFVINIQYLYLQKDQIYMLIHYMGY